jgi:putative ABC transport system permease protein
MTQIVIEVFVIAFIAISISLVTGTMIAKATSTQMINLGIGNSETPEMYNPYYGNITQEDVINAYQVDFNLEYVLVMYGVSLSTVLISTIGPMLYILRLKPKKILM